MFYIILMYSYRIPEGEQVYTIAPLRVRTNSLASIPPSATEVFIFGPQCFRQVFECLSSPPFATITTLLLDNNFNEPIDCLPPSLTSLTLGAVFYQPRHSPFGFSNYKVPISFNYPLDHLPPLLTHLTLRGPSFGHPLNNLPDSLLHLDVRLSCDQPVDHLPPSLTQLYLRDRFASPVDHLPPSLTLLHLEAEERGDIDWNFNLDHLPPSLTHLSLDNYFKFNKPLDNLPSALTYLDISRSGFNHPLDHLPHQLKELLVGYDFNYPVDNLPPTLITLELGICFDQPVDHLPHHSFMPVLGAVL